ncbi:MAG: WD40/YVTN/BNR-like repeat-containing protein, partial [Gemmatimonadaceae bacterium]
MTRHLIASLRTLILAAPFTLLGQGATPAKPATTTAKPATTAAKPVTTAGRPAATAAKPTAKAAPADTTPKSPFTTEAFGGLRARNIGPAMTSGRIGALAVHPNNPAIIYVGASSGNLWKSMNGGATWQPIMDREGAYSIAFITIDPRNPNIVWVGTGENNSQRSVAYGDGVYKSEDNGRTWKNVGLKQSEHIGKIVVDPTNSDVVYVAAQGPLWSAGGDRGLYKTTDGGKTWEQVLKISDNTGVTDVVVDPRNPKVVIASSYQRRRHFFTLIDGGPESAIHRSTDGGKTWTKVTTGLPGEELGRIGLAISPVNPDIVYANVEAANRKGGIYRSDDNGVTWEKRADYNQGSMYYGLVWTDPVDVNRIYIPDVIFQVSDDGGRTLRALGQRSMHVDNHVIWVDPRNTDHLLVGNDGGLYRSWDRGGTWAFFENLPVTQFYDVDVDYDLPFYHIAGGTQDNYSLHGPSRTRSDHGILNQDWVVTQGGDGFVSRIDPEDPNTIYAEAQHGSMVRVDRRTGQRVGIQPSTEPGEAPARWNWDTPILISPHLHTRLYTASQRLYRSEDRGNTWTAISGDLSRQVDRNAQPVMGKIWDPDAVAKNQSTALYGNISAISESPKAEGLLYVGTDDGLVQVSEDGGKNWRRVDSLPGVPKDAYIARIRASQHDARTVYVAVENHQNGDFKPYLLKSTDAGRTWSSITGDLPARGSTYAFAEDPVDPNLLFAGTEFAGWASKDGGKHWFKLPGLPTIAVRDLVIQKRENDLVIATFGRGFYVLDDYTPLRRATAASLKVAGLEPVRRTWLYMTTLNYGGRGKSFQGENFYTADNPPYGAVVTYFLPEALKTKQAKRVEAEKAAEKAGKPISYPSNDALKAEALEEAPTVIVTIYDSTGAAIRTFNGPVGKGFQRVAWDLRAAAGALARPRPAGGEGAGEGGGFGPTGPYVVPGTYAVAVAQRVDGVVTPIGARQTIEVVNDPAGTVTMADHAARSQFMARQRELQRQVSGAVELANATQTRLDAMRRAANQAPAVPAAVQGDVRAAIRSLRGILEALRGDDILAARYEGTPPSISQRVGVDMGRWLGRPTSTMERDLSIVAEQLPPQLAALRTLVQETIPRIEAALEKAGAPYTPGRIP